MNKEEKADLLTIEFSDIYELLVSLADKLPKACNCDGEYDHEGYIHGTECNNHKAERLLTELGL